MTRTRRTATAVVLALVLPLPVAMAAPALATTTTATASAGVHRTLAATATDAPAVTPAELPAPTGPYAVGRDILHLVDEHRQDPWVPSAGPRQLMVSMYYPARPGTGGPAPYMTTEAARLMLQMKIPGTTIPPEAVSETRTWSHTDAVPRHGRFPLVLLSPGFTMPRTEITSLAEDLAGRGYVVALVDHTYENSGTTFPDGKTLTCTICDDPDAHPPQAIEESRAKDLSFVIDALTSHRHPAWRHAHMIDGRRIGVAGHSLGGASAIPAMAHDKRVLAGVDLDGTMFAPVPDDGLGGRPFMMIGHPTGTDEDPTWTDAWSRLKGWKRWLTVTGSNHASFTDIPVLAEKLGIPEPPGTTLSPQRAVHLTRTYVAAFFDLHLRGIPEPILNGPTSAYPEVRFHAP
ncbi:alpha/beta hydrolase family protein [Streptomyces sp. NPDC020192]|uniref:alpha/beta hydrolase family protein n=1 Tax=Streptomyces sp. NPDC020192 TaxID=3365066 RepID=UPI0037B2B875